MSDINQLFPEITVTPDKCLADVPVVIKVNGLESNKYYTIACSVIDGQDEPFLATAHYRSDDSGCIDVSKQSSAGGHFTGVFPMGLFNNLMPKKRYHRFCYKDVTAPIKHQISVYGGPVASQLAIAGPDLLGLKPCCSFVHTRFLYSPGVTRTVVRSGKIRGTLHMPPGDGPFPGVIDMFGGAGGLMEHRAALLASRGFAALALAFFDYEDLPKTMIDFPLDYFEEAVNYLLTVDKVIKKGIGAIGISKSVEIVLNMALRIPKVIAPVVINGFLSSVQTSLTLKDGTVLPTCPMAIENILIEQEGVINALNVVCSPADHPESHIPVEDIPCDVLWIVGLADMGVQSELFADLAVSRCKDKSKNQIKVLKYPGTGHLVEAPYVPFRSVSMNNSIGAAINWGGSPFEHCQAQEHSWQEILAFFRDKLIPK